MNVFRSILASFVALALLAVAVPAAQADVAVQPPVCQHIVTGPDVYFGVCTDPASECALWTYNYGGETCHVPGAGVVPRAHCVQVLVGPDIDQGVCYDRDGQNVEGQECLVWWYNGFGRDTCYVPAPQYAVAAPPRAHCEQVFYGPDIDQGVCYDRDGQYVDGMNCIVWWYSNYSTGQDQCYVPYPPGAVAASSAAATCVGTGDNTETAVCYDPADGDGCDAYVTFHHNNYVCILPEPRSTVAASAAAPPRAFCQQVLVGPDIDQGLCYDLDGQHVAGINCIVWWYSTYSTGQDRCYVPYPPGAVAASAAAPPRAFCQQVLVGPDIDSGLCYDLDGEQVNGRECLVWWYANYVGNTVCYVPQPVTSGIDGTCYHLPDGAAWRSVCHDTTRDTCQVWAETYGADRCLT